MATNKRDYSQYLQSTRKVNISQLLAQQGKPRPQSELNQNLHPNSRYRPYHQDPSWYEGQQPDVPPYSPPEAFDEPYRAPAPQAPWAHEDAPAVRPNGSAPYASPYEAMPTQKWSLSASELTSERPEGERAPQQSAPEGAQLSPYAHMAAQVPPASLDRPANTPLAQDLPPWLSGEAQPQASSQAQAPDTTTPPWLVANRESSPGAGRPDFWTETAESWEPAPKKRAKSERTKAEKAPSQSRTKAQPTEAAPSWQSGESKPSAPYQAQSHDTTMPPWFVANRDSAPEMSSSDAGRPDYWSDSAESWEPPTCDKPAPKTKRAKAEPVQAESALTTAAEDSERKAAASTAAIYADMPDFATLLALPKQFYLELVAQYRREGVADPEQAALEATTMRPARALGCGEPVALAREAEMPASPPAPAAGQQLDGWQVAASADDIAFDEKYAQGWPGAVRFAGNFEERVQELFTALGLEVVSIEDKSYQKLCTLRAGAYKFKLSVFYKESGVISYVQSSGTGAKAQSAVRTMGDFVGFDIRNLPRLDELSDEQIAQLKQELNSKSKRRKRKTLAERNAELKLASTEEAARVVQEGAVNVEALAAEGKGQLLSVRERLELIVRSFDPKLQLKECAPCQYAFRFELCLPQAFSARLRISYRQTELISSVFLRLSDESAAAVEYEELLAQIKDACVTSLVGTPARLLVKPHSAKVNAEHVLQVQLVQF